MDPITTPLLVLVLGNFARDLIADASKDYLKGKLKSVFGWLEKVGERDKVARAYQDAMEHAYSACLEILLLNIKGRGYTDEELKQYRSSIEALIKDDKFAEELLKAVREPGRNDLPSPDVLRERWKRISGQPLPSDRLWDDITEAFRRQATRHMILSDELRELLNAQNLQQLRELIERQGGVKVQVRWDRYAQRMRTKFSPVDLANLMPAYADDPGRLVIRDLFVAQNVRESPPPIVIPKDLAERLRKGGHDKTVNDTFDTLDQQQLEKLRTAYVSQAPKPVLDVIASNRLLVLTGEPGSGKSTLMRYLLTGILERPIDRQTGSPLSWTVAFTNAFPLLIELRDFYAMRRRGLCDSFLEYVGYMGKTDQWFLDEHAVHNYLQNRPSLVMFDGLDEIFDTADRQRVMHEIAGFSERYPGVRIIVTSRPVGYREQVLRDAGFSHFGIQDLDDRQIEIFIRGWFALMMPQQSSQAEQRIDRVVGSVRRSKPIRLLAGNPMLLTIMALLAREEELPGERVKFYEKAVEVLCHHWDANRNLELPEEQHLNADDKKDLLRRIAMRMQAGEGGLKGNIIEEDDLEQEIQAFLIDEQWQPNAAEARKAARRMIHLLRERNYILCQRGPQLYGFIHRTFLEYLTAAEITRLFDRQPQQIKIDELIELFEHHCSDDEWREVLRLICGQLDDEFVGRIVEHLAMRTDLEPWFVNDPVFELPLAIWCLGEVRNLSRFEQLGSKLFFKAASYLCWSKPNLKWFDRDPWNLTEVLQATSEIASRWPGRPPALDWAYAQTSSIKNWDFWTFHTYAGLKEFGQFVVLTAKQRSQAMEFCVRSEPYLARQGAIQALAKRWPDEATRELVTDRAAQDVHSNPRIAALQSLAEKWPDETTRKLLVERAVQDESEWLRQAAIKLLAEKFPDGDTRKLLHECAINDTNKEPRDAALRGLVENWPDDGTRALLNNRLVQEEDKELRNFALETVVEKWRDETTRKLLVERAVSDDDALRLLAKTWPDENTYRLLQDLSIQANMQNSTRHTALDVLLDVSWPDERTRKLLFDRATERERSDKYGDFRGLARRWPDDFTRTLLANTLKDAHEWPRLAALSVLADMWADETTRNLLIERAVQEKVIKIRRTVLRTLVDKWPDETTRKLLEERAGVDRVAASVLDRWQSERK